MAKFEATSYHQLIALLLSLTLYKVYAIFVQNVQYLSTVKCLCVSTMKSSLKNSSPYKLLEYKTKHFTHCN